MMKAFLVSLSALASVLNASMPAFSEPSVREAVGGTEAALVVVDCESSQAYRYNPALAAQGFGPCSTFKIYNSLIGLEEGLISGPSMPFYKWDGQQRPFEAWNRDLTFKEAFQASCVPAFQELARKIGPVRMQRWLDKLGYGNRDLSGRPDAFWLPRAGQKTILISPDAQAELIRRLVVGDFGARESTYEVLWEVMRLEASERGVLYGKTGSGLRSSADGPTSGFDMGWLVGFLQNGTRKYAYACLVLGEGRSGKDAKRIVSDVFRKNGLL